MVPRTWFTICSVTHPSVLGHSLCWGSQVWLLGHVSVCPGPLTMLGVSGMIARSRVRLSWATHYVGGLRYNCSVTCPSVLGHSLCWGSQIWLLGHVSVSPGPLTMLGVSGMIARSRVRLSWATHYVGDLRYDCSVTCPSVLGHSLCWGSQTWLLGHVSFCPGPLTMLGISGMIARSRVRLSWATDYVGDIRYDCSVTCPSLLGHSLCWGSQVWLLGHLSICPGPLTMLGVSDMIARSRVRLSWATHYVGGLRYDCSVTCPSVLGHSLCWGSQVWLLGHVSVSPGPLTMLGVSGMIARSLVHLSWATHYVGDLRYDCSVTCPSVLDHSPCWGSQVWLPGHVSVCPGPLTMLGVSGMIVRSRVRLSWATHYVEDLMLPI